MKRLPMAQTAPSLPFAMLTIGGRTLTAAPDIMQARAGQVWPTPPAFDKHIRPAPQLTEAPETQAPATQESAPETRSPVQPSPSEQTVPFATGAVAQRPVAGAQVAVWQTLAEAGQTTGEAVQAPAALQMSPVVQRLPSLQAVLIGAAESAQRPVEGTQAFTWQATVLAEQVTDAVARHEPPWQDAAVTH